MKKPKPKLNSDRPNEPGVEAEEEEKRDASSVLDESAVTRMKVLCQDNSILIISSPLFLALKGSPVSHLIVSIFLCVCLSVRLK